MIMLTVVIPTGEYAAFAEKICRRELKGMDHEIIQADNWDEGLGRAKGEFISFLEPQSRVSKNYFKKNLRVFTSQPLFRKLVMVASSVDVPESAHKIYGYLLSLEGTYPNILPSRIQSSSEPYGIQVGYVPGAILRRNMIPHGLFFDDPVASSVKISLSLWEKGWRLLLNPNTVYSPAGTRRLDLPIQVEGLPETTKDLALQFKREMIG